MAKINITTDAKSGEKHYWFECPGCQEWHAFDKRWKFNGNIDKPTFKPSLLVRWTQGPKREDRRCHSFVTDGQIRFLKDCTHDKAGQTMDIPEWDENW